MGGRLRNVFTRGWIEEERRGEESGQEMMSKVGAAFIRHSTSYSVRRLTVTDRLPATRPRRALLADRAGQTLR